jgi:hypothetical protein
VYGHHPFSFFFEKKVENWAKGKEGKKEEKAIILLYYLQLGLIRTHF